MYSGNLIAVVMCTLNLEIWRFSTTTTTHKSPVPPASAETRGEK
jgi:hypothetical protein